MPLTVVPVFCTKMMGKCLMYVFSALRVSKQKKKNINVNKEQDIKNEDEKQYSGDVQSEGLRLSNSHIERENEEMKFGGKCGDENDEYDAIERDIIIGNSNSNIVRDRNRSRGIGTITTSLLIPDSDPSSGPGSDPNYGKAVISIDIAQTISNSLPPLFSSIYPSLPTTSSSSSAYLLSPGCSTAVQPSSTLSSHITSPSDRSPPLSPPIQSALNTTVPSISTAHFTLSLFPSPPLSPPASTVPTTTQCASAYSDRLTVAARRVPCDCWRTYPNAVRLTEANIIRVNGLNPTLPSLYFDNNDGRNDRSSCEKGRCESFESTATASYCTAETEDDVKERVGELKIVEKVVEKVVEEEEQKQRQMERQNGIIIQTQNKITTLDLKENRPTKNDILSDYAGNKAYLSTQRKYSNADRKRIKIVKHKDKSVDKEKEGGDKKTHRGSFWHKSSKGFAIKKIPTGRF